MLCPVGAGHALRLHGGDWEAGCVVGSGRASYCRIVQVARRPLKALLAKRVALQHCACDGLRALELDAVNGEPPRGVRLVA